MPKRHVTNEAELLACLAKHGFETVYPEELDVAQQIALFARARAILSPDSSALANAVFASPGADVGIMNWRGIYRPLWHGLAHQAGARTTYLHADPQVESHPVPAQRDLRIDTTLLEQWLAGL